MRVLTVVASVVFALLLTEASYRMYLFSTQPYRFRGDRNGWYFQQSPFRYNEEFGYEYVPGEVSGGAIYDGRVIQCWDPVSDWVINERGNSGSIKGSYDTAEVKILVFGDSVTQRPRRAPNGEMMTWPNYLQDLLEEELGKSVHVVNFGRDAYGVLQMLDCVGPNRRMETGFGHSGFRYG